jgi:hypothetical protein
MEATHIRQRRLVTVEVLEVPIVWEAMRRLRVVGLMVVLEHPVVEMPVLAEREPKQVTVGLVMLLPVMFMVAVAPVPGVLVPQASSSPIKVKVVLVPKVVCVLPILMWNIVLRWRIREIQFAVGQSMSRLLMSISSNWNLPIPVILGRHPHPQI